MFVWGIKLGPFYIELLVDICSFVISFLLHVLTKTFIICIKIEEISCFTKSVDLLLEYLLGLFVEISICVVIVIFQLFIL